MAAWTRSPTMIEGGPKFPAPIQAACDQVQMALRQLMEADPEGWQSHLAGIVALETHLDPDSIGCLADQITALDEMAQTLDEDRMEEELMEEDGEGDEDEEDEDL